MRFVFIQKGWTVFPLLLKETMSQKFHLLLFCLFFKVWQRLVWDNNAFLFYQTRFSREYDKFQLKLICKHPLAFLCIYILIQLWLYLSLSPSWLCLILISAFQQMFLTRHVFNLFTGNSQNIQTKTRRAHQSSSNLQQRHQ